MQSVYSLKTSSFAFELDYFSLTCHDFGDYGLTQFRQRLTLHGKFFLQSVNLSTLLIKIVRYLNLFHIWRHYCFHFSKRVRSQLIDSCGRK